MSEQGAIIEFSNCSFSYNRGIEKVDILDNVSFSIREGDFIKLTGPSGAGKTTIALLCAGLLKPNRGSISIHKGSKPRRKSSPVQIVFQDPYSSINPKRTIDEWFSIALGQSLFTIPFKMRPVERKCSKRLKLLLESVGLSKNILSKHPTELSGGECQRAAIVAALLTEPRCIIFDEPVSMLDLDSKQSVITAIRESRKLHRASTVLISHEEINIDEHIQRVFSIIDKNLIEY